MLDLVNNHDLMHSDAKSIITCKIPAIITKCKFVLRTHTFTLSIKVMRRVLRKSCGSESIFDISDSTADTAKVVIS